MCLLVDISFQVLHFVQGTMMLSTLGGSYDDSCGDEGSQGEHRREVH